MKKLLLLTLALSLAVTQVTRADNKNEKKRHKRQADDAPSQQASATAPQNVRGAAPQQPQPQQRQPQQRQPQAQRNTVPNPRAGASVQTQPVRGGAQIDGRDRTRTQPTNQVATQNRDRNVDTNRNNSQASVRRNGANRNYNRNSFNVARTKVVRTPHNRAWWRSHYNTTFVLFGGGYYYWFGGYWYPAYGYDSYYNNYSYGEPIYGYNDLSPGQVIENVQLALRDEGYYPGAIDGLVGPQTRAALAAYQRDHGLIVTAAVDEPTLVTLGLA